MNAPPSARRHASSRSLLAGLLLASAIGPGALLADHGLAGPTAQAQAPPELDEMPFSTSGWATDFSRSSVPFSEIRPGGPPRDGIPAIEAPVFESVEAAQQWLDRSAPVIALDVDGRARAYPLAILVWHEIVNDVAGGMPIVITFCPLCNTALVFERRLDGVVYDFGTTGNLRYSDLIMYDRQTETWWQQATGQAIVGALNGARLAFLPAQLISLQQFAAAWPEGQVLSRDTGYERRYASGSYAGHDATEEGPFRYSGEPIGGIPPKERVVTLGQGADGIAFPHSSLRAAGVAEETVGSEPIVVFWEPRVVRSEDEGIVDDDRSVGSSGVFSAMLDGRRLSFVRHGGEGADITDLQTGSTWTVTGRAVDGPLAGARLRPVAHADHFWFAWAAFVPDTRIWTSDGTDSDPTDE